MIQKTFYYKKNTHLTKNGSKITNFSKKIAQNAN